MRGFSPSSVGKEPAGNAGDLGSIPGWGRSSGEGNGNPLQYSRLENPKDRGAWRATVHGVTRVGHDLATKPPTTTKGWNNVNKRKHWDEGSLGSRNNMYEVLELDESLVGLMEPEKAQGSCTRSRRSAGKAGGHLERWAWGRQRRARVGDRASWVFS